jgi:hypothetical protein
MRFQFFTLILLFISFGLFTASCKKEHSNLPATLYHDNFTFKDEAKIYTKDGEITDPAVKARSITSTGLDLILHQPFNPQAASAYRVTFSSNDLFLMGSDHFRYEKLSDRLIFKYIDSSIVTIENESLVFEEPFFKYPELKKNSDGTYTSRRQFVGYGDYTALNISGMDLCILRRDAATGAITERRVGFHLNEFNTNGISTLGKYDTLAVREYSYHYALIK